MKNEKMYNNNINDLGDVKLSLRSGRLQRCSQFSRCTMQRNKQLAVHKCLQYIYSNDVQQQFNVSRCTHDGGVRGDREMQCDFQPFSNRKLPAELVEWRYSEDHSRGGQ